MPTDLSRLKVLIVRLSGDIKTLVKLPPWEDETDAALRLRTSYVELCGLAAELGLPRPPGADVPAGDTREQWIAWMRAFELWTHEAFGQLKAKQRQGKGGRQPKKTGRPRKSKTGKQPTKQLPLKGMRFTEKDVPDAFREGGKPKGAVLTTQYLEETPEWSLFGPYLSRHYGEGQPLTTHVKVGRQNAYLFKEVAALRNIKTANQAKREKEDKAEWG